MAVTSRDLTAGFRGNVYRDGVKMGGAQSWTLTRDVTITEEGVLDQAVDVPVEQKKGYTLRVDELVIDSQFSKTILDADANNEQLRFLFIGERRRNDGQIERVRMDGATISAEALLAGITRGETAKRSLQFRLDTVPSFDSAI